MGSLSSTKSLEVTIKPITSEADLPHCARLADIALKPDGLHEFKTRYGTRSVYQETLEKLQECLDDDRGSFRLFKAVVSSSSIAKSSDGGTINFQTSNEPNAETIVGFAQWRYGYVEAPKMDSFQPQKKTTQGSSLEDGVTSVAVADTSKQNTPAVTPKDTDQTAAEDA